MMKYNLQYSIKKMNIGNNQIGVLNDTEQM